MIHPLIFFFVITNRTAEVGRLLELCRCLHVVVQIPVDGIPKQCNYTKQQEVDIIAPCLRRKLHSRPRDWRRESIWISSVVPEYTHLLSWDRNTRIMWDCKENIFLAMLCNPSFYPGVSNFLRYGSKFIPVYTSSHPYSLWDHDISAWHLKVHYRQHNSLQGLILSHFIHFTSSKQNFYPYSGHYNCFFWLLYQKYLRMTNTRPSISCSEAVTLLLRWLQTSCKRKGANAVLNGSEKKQLLSLPGNLGQ